MLEPAAQRAADGAVHDAVSSAVDVLAERLNCPPDQALDHLRRLADSYHIELDEAATAVLAAVPGPGSSGGADDPLPAEFRSHRYRPAPARATGPATTPSGDPLVLTDVPRPPLAPDVQAIFDVLPGAVVFLEPVREGERVVDYRVVAASPEAADLGGRRGRELVGTSIVADYPTVEGSELWLAYKQVLATGRPRAIGPFAYREEAEGSEAEALVTLRAHAFRDGLLVSWVRNDEQRRYAARLAQTERLGNLGWAEWDLISDTVEWSEGVFEIIERPRAAGPATLDEIGRLVHPDDRDRVGNAVAALLERAVPVDVTYRLQLPSGIKHVRAIFEATPDAKGRARKAYGILQDVTAVEAAERDRVRLADIEAKLADRQRSLQAEHRLVAALQQVIMPVPGRAVALPGLEVAVSYQPAERLARVGGDWYDLIALPGGRSLLVVGDVAGHGITAAAAMVRLRHALAALAVTTSDPADLLGYLNRIACEDATTPTASVIVARYDPPTSTLAWAQAGHPPPVMLSSGTARSLDRPPGRLVGARLDTEYANAALRLSIGEVLVLYTDGLVERRSGYQANWADPLLAAMPADSGLDRMLATLRPANPDDDMCVLALQVIHRAG
jgi:serine phosphatase RsbU (regulator of sigma subunit)/PAS domain-containing protein